jgi:hypothetical protein
MSTDVTFLGTIPGLYARGKPGMDRLRPMQKRCLSAPGTNPQRAQTGSAST